MNQALNKLRYQSQSSPLEHRVTFDELQNAPLGFKTAIPRDPIGEQTASLEFKSMEGAMFENAAYATKMLRAEKFHEAAVSEAASAHPHPLDGRFPVPYPHALAGRKKKIRLVASRRPQLEGYDLPPAVSANAAMLHWNISSVYINPFFPPGEKRSGGENKLRFRRKSRIVPSFLCFSKGKSGKCRIFREIINCRRGRTPFFPRGKMDSYGQVLI